MNDARWCVVMNNLLYPAVLGTLIYTGFNYLSSPALGVEEALLMLALFVLYIMDYAHSVSDGNRKTYTRDKFWWDLTIVACLFFAGNAILGNNIFPAIHPAWWLLATKTAAVLWENLGHTTDKWPVRSLIEVETDSAFMLIYFVIALSSLAATVPTLILAAAIAGDAYYYHRFESLVQAAGKPGTKPRARRARARMATA